MSALVRVRGSGQGKGQGYWWGALRLKRLGSEVRVGALRLSLSACSGRLPTTYHLLLTTYYLP